MDSDFLPNSPRTGPPLPRFLNIRWPWVKGRTAPPGELPERFKGAPDGGQEEQRVEQQTDPAISAAEELFPPEY